MDLRITSKRLKSHFQYSKVIYIAAFFTMAIVWNLIYSATKPPVPGDKQVVIISAAYILDESAQQWVDELATVLPDDQELIDFFTISYGEDAGTGAELMFARLAAEEGDIWLVPQDVYHVFAFQGAWMALDVPDESGQTILDRLHIPECIDPSYAVTNLNMPGMEAETTEEHIAGIPIDAMEGFFELGMSPVDMVICIPVYTENIDNVITTINWMLDNKQTYTPPASDE